MPTVDNNTRTFDEDNYQEKLTETFRRVVRATVAIVITHVVTLTLSAAVIVDEALIFARVIYENNARDSI